MEGRIRSPMFDFVLFMVATTLASKLASRHNSGRLGPLVLKLGIYLLGKKCHVACAVRRVAFLGRGATVCMLTNLALPLFAFPF